MNNFPLFFWIPLDPTINSFFKPYISFIGAKIFWCLNKWFPPNFWPKTTNIYWSKTNSIVFVIKRAIFFSSWSYFRTNNKSFLTMGVQWVCQKYRWHWFVLKIEHVKKLSEWSHDFPNGIYFCTLSVLRRKKTIGFMIMMMLMMNIILTMRMMRMKIMMRKTVMMMDDDDDDETMMMNQMGWPENRFDRLFL